MYATLTPEGEFTLVEEKPTLEAMQKAVGGYVEAVEVQVEGMTIDIWLNEEGKLIGLPPNPKVTRLAREAGSIWPSDYIAGTVMFTGGADRWGNTMKLSKRAVEFLKIFVKFA